MYESKVCAFEEDDEDKYHSADKIFEYCFEPIGGAPTAALALLFQHA
jgi:hypothetical protein